MINIYICDLKSNNKTKHILIEKNTTISDLLDMILRTSEDINVGVFGKLVDKSYTLQDNDRVEFYDKILIDPKIERKNKTRK